TSVSRSSRRTDAHRHPTSEEEEPLMAVDGNVTDAAKALALGLGTGFGAIGPGAGVGYLVGKTIQGGPRRRELRGDPLVLRRLGLMFLGLALTEAITFYALLMSFVAFFIA